MIAIKNTVTYQLIHSYIVQSGRYSILICNIDNVLCTLVNTYVPNTRQISFLNKIQRKLKRVKQGRLFSCGDFNGIG